MAKHCIKQMYELHYKEHIPCNDIIKNVVLIAGATSIFGKEDKYNIIFNKMINGKLINCYSKEDQVLNVLYILLFQEILYNYIFEYIIQIIFKYFDLRIK